MGDTLHDSKPKRRERQIYYDIIIYLINLKVTFYTQ